MFKDYQDEFEQKRIQQRELARANIEQARISHAAHRDGMKEEIGMLSSFSNNAMRAPAVASAAGIAALLGFYTANSAVLKGSPGVWHFNSALTWFFVAIFLCVIAPGLAYFSQGFLMRARSSYEFAWEHPYVRQTRVSKKWRSAGRVFQVTAVLCVLGAIGCLVFGAWQFMAVANFVAGSPM